VKVSGISRAAFAELAGAVAQGQEGYANGLIDKINVELSKALNFTKYWSQDRDFQLLTGNFSRSLTTASPGLTVAARSTPPKEEAWPSGSAAPA